MGPGLSLQDGFSRHLLGVPSLLRTIRNRAQRQRVDPSRGEPKHLDEFPYIRNFTPATCAKAHVRLKAFPVISLERFENIPFGQLRRGLDAAPRREDVNRPGPGSGI